MIEVHVIAGDDNGGPYTEVVMDLDREADDLRDDEVEEWRNTIRAVFRNGFGEDPANVIVYVEEVPGGEASRWEAP